MPRIGGTQKTIGGQCCNFYYFDYSTSNEPANNRTLVTWNLGFRYNGADAQLDNGDININGGPLEYDVPGRVKNFNGTYTVRDHVITNSSSFYVDHDTNGAGSFTVEGSMAGNIGTPSVISLQTITLTNYVRTPNTPSTPTLVSRNRENISMSTSATLPGGTVAAPAISSYTWQVSTDASNWSTISGQTGSTLSWTGAVATTQYYFRALATNSEGSSGYSAASAIVSGAPSQPVAPTLQRSGTIIAPTLTTPAANGSTLSTFTLDYSTSSSFPSGSETVTVANIGTSVPPVLPALIAGTTYYFRYRVGSNRGDSLNSPSSNITIPPIPVAPDVPVPLSKQVRKVTFDWTAPTLNGAALTSYQVEARYSSDGGSTWENAFTLLGSTNSATSIFTSEDLNIAKLYQFRVRAVTDVGNTPYSSTEELTEFNSIFISAYGYRHDGTNFDTAVQFAARYTGNSEDSVNVGGTTYTGWKTIENVKRFDGSEFISLTQ
jgi:hypothetical protein